VPASGCGPPHPQPPALTKRVGLRSDHPSHVVAYCGAGDPFAPLADVDNFRQELIEAEARNYQITVFGGAGHGFTDPFSADLHLEGVEYDALSNDVSWSGTLVLLQHVFGRSTRDGSPPSVPSTRDPAICVTPHERSEQCPRAEDTDCHWRIAPWAEAA
jgi:Dienelactone hydrolase family